MGRDTRKAVARAARDLFVRKGYAATSLREVAQRAGIAKATVYHHFPDKRSIMDELITEAIASTAADRDVIQSVSDPHDRLSRAAEAMLGFLSLNGDIMQVARREVPACRDRLQTEGGRALHAFEESVAEAIREGRRQGAFRAGVDPEEAAGLFMSLLQGSFAHGMLQGTKQRSTKKAAAALMDLFLNGIATKHARRSAGVSVP